MKRIMCVVSLFIVLFVSCDNSTLFKEYDTTANLEWSKSDVKTFTFENVDDTSTVDVLFAFRYAHGFQYKEVAVAIQETSPSKTNSLPLLFKVINADGSYIGEGSGDIWDIEVPISQNVKLEKGTHSFQIGHAMPIELLQMVMEVGVVVRKK